MVYKKNLPPQLQNYEMVEDRLVRFWKHCPNGRLKTEVVEIFDNGDRVLMKATMWINREDSHPVSTGIAMDWKNKKGMVNSTNWIENTETSCLGRCISSSPFATEQTTARWLGMKEAEVGKLGKAPRPSREEMEIALGRQKQLKAEEQQPEVDKFYEEVEKEQQTPISQNDLKEVESVSEQDIKDDVREVEFRNFCEELQSKGKLKTESKKMIFEHLDNLGLETAIESAGDLGHNFNTSVKKELKQTSLVSEDKVFETFEEFIKWKKDTYREKMVALNPDVESSDVRLLLNVAYREGQALKVGRKNYQEGVEYWNKNIKGKPYSIKEKEKQDLDLKNIPIVSPKDIPSMMEDAGIKGEVQEGFEEFPKLVKKITYKNPDYQSSVKQQDLILKCCKFRNIEPERLHKYLEQELNTSLTDLTIQEASWLIDGFFGEKKNNYK